MSPWGYGAFPPHGFPPHGYPSHGFPSPFNPFTPWAQAQGTPTSTGPTASQSNALPTLQPASKTEEDVYGWCQQHGLGADERDALKELGFKVGDQLDALSDGMWEAAKVRPLCRMRILAAYNASTG